MNPSATPSHLAQYSSGLAASLTLFAAALASRAFADIVPETVVMYTTHVEPNNVWTNETYLPLLRLRPSAGSRPGTL